MGTALPWYNCPSRRGSELTPLAAGSLYRNAAETDVTATISYGASWGNTRITVQAGINETFLGDPAFDPPAPENDNARGVAFWSSRVRTRQVVDGLSKTHLICELQAFNSTDVALGENLLGIGTPMAGGYVTTAALRPGPDSQAPLVTMDTLLQFVAIEMNLGRMGSSHPATFNVALCDGSVQAVAFDIDAETHCRRGGRQDGIIENDIEDCVASNERG